MKKTPISLLPVLVLTILWSCAGNRSNSMNTTATATNTDPIDKKVDSLLALMTLEEKVGQMNQYNGFFDATGPTPQEGNSKTKYEHIQKGWVGSMLNVRGVDEVRAVQKIAVEQSRLGIPLIFGSDIIHGYKTLAPIPLAESASWDLEAIEKSARNAAIEASATGLNWTFAPNVDISRDARWGRVMEGAGEDPYYGSLVAAARVRGFQGDDLSAHNTILACAKHFAGYGFSEAGRDYNTVDINRSTLHNVVLPPFKAAVDANVKTLMNSFNELDGIPATANSYLQRELLKEKWGFDGFVVSDWGSIGEIAIWGAAENLREAAKKAAIAGSDMDMESYAYVEHLVALVKDGEVPESVIDEAAGRILKAKFELGLFDDPYKYCDETREITLIGSEQQNQDALDIAKKSIVLLKNQNNLLPLKKSGQDVLVIGDLADDKNSPLGSWRIGSDNETAVSILEGMKQYDANISYQQGVRLTDANAEFTLEVQVNETDPSGIDAAVQAAKGKDVVVMVLGEHGFQSGEGRSRTDLDLPGLQQELLEAVYAVNKNIVLVLNNGRPLAISWADENIPAIVEAWHLGTQAGNAVAAVLYGDHNPGGKLTLSFPRNIGQVPIYYNYKMTGRPTNLPGAPDDLVFWSHYSDVENTPLYPFGYGLSYTTFDYDQLSLSNQEIGMNDKIEIQVRLTNTGEVAGTEVAQLYIRDKVASITRPVRELKGFKKVSLAPGESTIITFELDQSTLGYYNNDGEYMVEPGTFEIFVGGDSYADLTSSFRLK
ncbi:beta-glucosidase BglX [Nonlabens xiamenensis]|uniref:beta-glucosidase BglX n=1 Tax=Nonlabens xiamenensis TaxID=2341043 RepID=UPI0037428097